MSGQSRRRAEPNARDRPIEARHASRTAILTLPLSTNYGGILQAIALYNFLRRNGQDVTLLRQKVNRPIGQRLLIALLQRLPAQNIAGVRKRFLRRSSHRGFIKRWAPSQTREIASQQGLRKAILKGRFNAIVVGSDQVWRNAYVPDAEFTNFFLDFVPDNIRKISYAASFGQSAWTATQFTNRIRPLLARFHRVTVREASGVTICRDTFAREDAELVLDPTLLMPSAFYAEMAGHAPPPGPAKRLMTYVLDPVPSLAALEAQILATLGDGAISQGIQLDDGDGLPPSVPEWLRGFRDADFVLTDSFHGMVFAIIFRKQFLALVNMKRGADRFTSLAVQLGVEDRLIFSDQQPAQLPLTAIDYATVARRHEERAEASARILLDALEEPA